MSPPRHDGDCDCCVGPIQSTPRRIANRPGLPTIAHRAGTWATFRRSMFAGLSRSPGTGRLRTRDDRDLTIALVDAWAVVGDVLTFAVERTANEQYLRTATERRSIDAMAHLIGYRLQPGIAASTWLAFALETAQRSPPVVPIDATTKVQSLPGPGERPQVFETVEPVEARGDWNCLSVVTRVPRSPRDGDVEAWLDGTGLGLDAGAQVALVGPNWLPTAPAAAWEARQLTSVDADPRAQVTRVAWHDALTMVGDADGVEVHLVRRRASLFGHNAPDPRLFTADVRTDLGSALTSNDEEWVFALATETIHLDAEYEGLEPGGRVLLANPDVNGGQPELATIVDAVAGQRSAYGLSGRVTRLELDHSASAFGGQRTRGTTVMVDSQRLPVGHAPLLDPVAGPVIDLTAAPSSTTGPRRILVRGPGPRARGRDGVALIVLGDDGTSVPTLGGEEFVVLSLDEAPAGAPEGHQSWRLRMGDGREGTVTGAPDALEILPAAVDDPVIGEVALVEPVPGTTSQVMLVEPLRNAYDRAGLEVWGNVAAATHGESVRDEVLGSGDAAATFQHFTLARAPVTHVRADDGGATSTLGVWVDGALWEEVPALFGRGPRDRVYVTREGDDGRTVVRFGDGATGARLPTGRDNVRADYRVGSGPDGHVNADQLTLLMTRPLGVRGVTNPIPSAGAVARQDRADARANAPRTVLTHGRIVSLRDYEDFARDHPGMAKAAAIWTWDGSRRGVLVTVAATDGAVVGPGDEVHDTLVTAIADAAGSRVPVAVTSHRPASFRLRASVWVSADRRPEDVLAAVRHELGTAFSFAAGDLGRAVPLSVVYEVVHRVTGVEAVDIDQLSRDQGVLEPVLTAAAPMNGDPPTTPGAELLVLDPATLDDVEVAP